MNELEILKSLKELEQLTTACIDSSSIIYMKKINLLDTASRNIKLCTINEVVNEISFNIKHIKTFSTNYKSSTDNKLLKCAIDNSLSVISEDKYILNNAKKNKLPHFNTLMILNFLFYKKIINEIEYHKFIKNLKLIAYYSDFIWKYGNEIFLKIKKIIS